MKAANPQMRAWIAEAVADLGIEADPEEIRDLVFLRHGAEIAANEAIGKAKQGVGEAVGSDRLQGEGVIQEIKGKGQKAVGDAKEATKDAVNEAAASANRNL